MDKKIRVTIASLSALIISGYFYYSQTSSRETVGQKLPNHTLDSRPTINSTNTSTKAGKIDTSTSPKGYPSQINDIMNTLLSGNGDRFAVAKSLLIKHKDDLLISSTLMLWMLEQDPYTAATAITGIYDKITPAMKEAFRKYAIMEPDKAWKLISSLKDWRERNLFTGLFDELAKNATTDEVKAFLLTSNAGSFSTYFAQSISKIAPEGDIPKMKAADEYLQQAKERGLDVNQAILSMYPKLFKDMMAQGTYKLEEAAKFLDTSPLKLNPEAMSAFAESFVKADAALAFDWIGRLPKESRTQAVETAAETLAKTNKDIATDLAFNGDLTLEDRKLVMFQLHFAVAGPNGDLDLFSKTGTWLKQNNMDVSELDERAGRPKGK